MAIAPLAIMAPPTPGPLRWVALLAMSLLPAIAPAQEFYTLKGHGGPIMDIAVDDQGRIATASFDNSLGLWTAGSPRWLEGHEAAVTAVIFGADGAVYSGSDDFTLRRWSTGEVIGRHRARIAGLAAAPGLIASASWDRTIGLWPLDGAAPRRLEGHGGGVNAVAFSRDFSRLYSASGDGTLQVWDVATGQPLRRLVRHGFGINVVAVNSRAGWLAYGAVDGVTRVIDIDTGALLRDFTLERRPILALALSPDGSRLGIGDGQGYITVIDTRAWRIERDFRATLRGPIWALAWSGDGGNLHAGGLDDALYSWPVAAMDRPGAMTPGQDRYLRDAREMTNGEAVFLRRCSICHDLTPGRSRRAGPTLNGLFGRRAGTVADYRYSTVLDGSAIVWDDSSIDALFGLGPDHFIPGSKMPMQRITNARDRRDLIGFLRRAGGEAEP